MENVSVFTGRQQAVSEWSKDLLGRNRPAPFNGESEEAAKLREQICCIIDAVAEERKRIAEEHAALDSMPLADRVKGAGKSLAKRLQLDFAELEAMQSEQTAWVLLVELEQQKKTDCRNDSNDCKKRLEEIAAEVKDRLLGLGYEEKAIIPDMWMRHPKWRDMRVRSQNSADAALACKPERMQAIVESLACEIEVEIGRLSEKV